MQMARIAPAIVDDGGTVYAIGGENTEGRLRSIEVFDDRRWNVAGVMRVPRVRHTATLLDDGQFLVAGGGFDDRDSRLAELWDGDKLVPAGRMRFVRSRHTATRLPDGRVLVIGGRDEHEQPIADAEIWDPKTRTWHAAGTLGHARCCHTATLLADGRVLVVGGQVRDHCLWPDEPRPCLRSTDSVELWDPKTGRFSPGPPLGEDNDRAAHTATLLRDGRVLIAGGAPAPFDDPDTRARYDLVFDPATSRWTTIEDGVHRAYHTATLLADGSVLAIGGTHDTCGCCATLPGAGPFMASIRRFDPATDTWSGAGESLVARDRHGAALLDDGSVLVVGGESQEWGDTDRPFAGSERWFAAAPR